MYTGLMKNIDRLLDNVNVRYGIVFGLAIVLFAVGAFIEYRVTCDARCLVMKCVVVK